MDNLIKEISDLVSEIRTDLLANGFTQAAIAFKKSKLVDAKEKELGQIKHWLMNFRDNEVAAVKKAYSAVPKSMWEYYEIMNLKGYAEQRILREKKEKLRIIWRGRPQLLRKYGVIRTKKTKS